MAEFPELGKHCAVSGCKQLDFLPLICAHCNLVFCKDHYSVSGHECSGCPDDNQCKTVKPTSHQRWKCSVVGCKSKNDVVHQTCSFCDAHICLQHRHEPPKAHLCSSLSEQELPDSQSISDQDKNKKKFADAFNAVEKEIGGKLQIALTSKKTKDKDMANRLILMRLKSRAVGAPKASVPESCRAYFDIFPPATQDVQPASIAVYVSKMWSLGRATEAIEKIFKLHNKSCQKLRLLFHSTGKIISDDISRTIGSLIDDGILVDGATLVLEYVDEEKI